MSDLSNQQQNQSFVGILQVPGGVTSTLKQVQDGDGNNTGLWLSSTNTNIMPYDAEEQVITATAGQTVFNLSISYTPATDSLQVFVNGLNKIVGIDYLETDTDTVTFLSGQSAGALVKFTTAAMVSNNAVDASNVAFVGVGGEHVNVQDLADPVGSDYIGFVQSGTGAVTRSVQDKERELVSVKDFGAVGDGVTNDTIAFQKFSAYINSVGAGEYLIPPAEYIVGSQTFAGSTGLGYSYLDSPVLTITGCTESVVINACGAKLKIADGLKYGAFDPVTGSPYASTSPFYNSDYYAIVGNAVSITNNTGKVTIKGLEVDGNQSNFTIGGPCGDSEIQLAAYGVICLDNNSVHLDDCYFHHCGLDGVYVNHASTHGFSEKAYPVLLSNVRSEYNARQGLSYCGGKGLTAINSQFNYTGKGALFASPSSGLDLEGESGGYAVNGIFINCEFANNKGSALTATVNYADISFYRCNFYGTSSSYALLIYNPSVRFFDCFIGGSNAIAGSTSTESDRVYFRNCNFNSASDWQGISTTWTAQPIIASASGNPIFDVCTFNTSTTTVPLNFSTTATSYNGCKFTQNGYLSTSYPRGTYTGNNVFDSATGTIDLNGSVLNDSVQLLGAGSYSGVNFDSNPSGGYTALSTSNFQIIGKNTYQNSAAAPLFIASLASNQSVANFTFVKLLFTSESVDTAGNFDAPNARFTPTIAGYYIFSVSSEVSNGAGLFNFLLRKNGTTFAQGGSANVAANTFGSGCSGIAYCNGTTDYVEAYILQNSGAAMTVYASGSHFSGGLLRPISK